MPAIPAKGSVGASGDLAPLSHMTLAMLGVGEVRMHGVLMPAPEALAQAGIAPVVLAAKEGLALINGTQVSTALALHGLFMAERLLEAGFVSGALSLDAAKVLLVRRRLQPGDGQRLLFGAAVAIDEFHAASTTLANDSYQFSDKMPVLALAAALPASNAGSNFYQS